jgi:enamine deaminase RidA (YjgF/YER057c/UK114 family)
MMASKSAVRPADVPANLAFSPAIRVGNLLFISGQVALDEGRNVIGAGNCGAQTEHIFRSLEAILQAAGAGLGDIVKTTNFLVDPADYAAFNQTRMRVLTADPPPASSSVFVKALVHPELLIEIEAIALIPKA